MSIDLDQAKIYLEQLDLTYIVNAMCADTYSLPRWIKAEALHCAALYKNFLWLNKKYYPETLVPTREIDEFWHNHILYTQNYVQDCAKIFGFYFHHEPSTPDEDVSLLVSQFVKTKELYLKEFGKPLILIK